MNCVFAVEIFDKSNCVWYVATIETLPKHGLASIMWQDIDLNAQNRSSSFRDFHVLFPSSSNRGSRVVKATKGSNPWEDIAPLTISEALRCFTIGSRQLTRNAFVDVRQTDTRSVVWNNVNDDSSDQMTCSHCSCGQLKWSQQHCSLFQEFYSETDSFGIATLPCIFAAFNYIE
ncbi:hypothetical protein TNCV_4567781 [Trichonephila clavipes]|nr:hypothetical protein TNCV_4567781 [Trichonephila clavipes]